MNTELKGILENIYRDILEAGLARYENGNPVDKKDREAFFNIREKTKPIFQLIDRWEELTLATIHELPVMPNQVQNTKDNMELLLLHSFYHDVKRKRFMELYHSIDYVLKQMKG
jgi:hypothetical protein